MNIDELIEWSKEQKEFMLQQIAQIRDGTFRPVSNKGAGDVDQSDFWIAEYQKRISSLDKIVSGDIH